MQQNEFRRRSVSAVKWSMAGTAAQFLLQFAIQTVLARILGPENFGIFAMSFIAVTLCILLCEGLSWGVVQSPRLGTAEARVVFTWQVLFGMAVTALLVFAAIPVSVWFNDPRVAPVLQWLSIVGLLTALSSTPSNLIRRELDMRYLNLVKVASYILAYLGVGLPLALTGHGVHALVAAAVVQALCTTVLVWIRLPHPLHPLMRHAGGGALLATGLTAVVTNICNWIMNNLDRLILGRIMPASAMGTYTIGGNLANIPGMLLLSSLQPAFLATGARIQDDTARLRTAYLSILATIWIVISPLFVMLSLLAPEIIALLYGEAWQAAGGVLAILALAMPPYVTWGLSTPVLWNTGRKHLEVLLQMPVMLAAGIAFLLLARHGMLVLASVAATTLFLRAVVTCVAACRLLGISLGQLWPSLLRGAVTMLLAISATLPVAQLVRSHGETPLAVVMVSGAAGGTALFLAVYLFPNLLGPGVQSMLERFSIGLPSARTHFRKPG